MLCRLKEFKRDHLKEKCFNYWPVIDKPVIQFDEFKITLTNEKK